MVAMVSVTVAAEEIKGFPWVSKADDQTAKKLKKPFRQFFSKQCHFKFVVFFFYKKN